MQATASNHYVSGFYHLAVERGLDADALLRQAEIDPNVIDAPDRRVDAEKLATLLVSIWDALQDEGMSLTGSRIPRGSFYMVGKLTIHEPNLQKVLEQIVRFYGFVTSAFAMDLAVDGDTALLTIKQHNPALDRDHLHSEFSLLCWHRYCSWLIAENIPLKEIFFSYSAPPHVKEYAFLFPGIHVFDAPFMGLTFSRNFLRREVVQPPGALKSFMRRCPLELFLRPKSHFTLTAEIHSLLSRRVNDRLPIIEEVAGQLHLTTRTLMRKLKSEGTSFQQIKERIRRDRAIYFLTNRTCSVAAIAEKVGFSDASVFGRAFKSWTKMSPKEYRETLGKQQIPGRPV
jgi:AraC-like DNA-binding protein